MTKEGYDCLAKKQTFSNNNKPSFVTSLSAKLDLNCTVYFKVI